MVNKENQYSKELGPVVHYFLQKLHEYIKYFDDGKTTFLFCSRAGVTMYDLYGSFLESKNKKMGANCKIFWTSRFLCAKSFLSKGCNLSIEIIRKEYSNRSAKELLQALLAENHQSVVDQIDFENADNQTAEFYIEQISSKSHGVRDVVKALECEFNIFDEYLANLIEKNNRVVLIDSGWQGTIHSLLANNYPTIDFHSLFFGRIGTALTNKKYFSQMYGLIFEYDIERKFNSYNPLYPQSALVLHRHLIECFFETSFSSVEALKKVDGKVVASNYEQIMLEQSTATSNEMLSGVISYLNVMVPMLSRGHVQKAFFDAIDSLSEKIAFPTRKDVQRYGENIQRSFDFGKKGAVNVILEPKNRFSGDTPLDRIESSLWSQGQIAMEYNSARAKLIQKQRLSFPKAVDYNNASVAIITRTKNRPIMLKRAAESVSSQVYKNYRWVVINDGGDINEVRQVIERCGVDPFKITLVHNPKSIGMEAASNKGIQSCESKYITIHDDDDSWEPNFLLETITFLEQQSKETYGGVITGTKYISEEIKNNKIIFHSSKPYNNWVKVVPLSEMAKVNFFAPIAFVFLRAHYEKIGGFDESLPVLGDWDFNLRFLLIANIGVCEKVLANYHHRDVNTARSGENYSNSVIGNRSKHLEYETIIRNKYLQSENQNLRKLAFLLDNGYHQKVQQYQMNLKINELRAYYNQRQADFIKKLRNKDCLIKEALTSAEGDEFNFDEDHYLSHNPDVKRSVEGGAFLSGLAHFIKHGWEEGREYTLAFNRTKQAAAPMPEVVRRKKNKAIFSKIKAIFENKKTEAG